MQGLREYPLKVSIITVCLNSKRYLEEAIKSVSGQTYANIEHLIIDGGSTDGSIEIFDKYRDRIDKLVIERDNGIFDAMNKGISLASGEILYFLNSDDRFYDSQVIKKAVETFTGHQEIDFMYGDIVVFDPFNKISYVEKHPEGISKWLFIKGSIAHPATFFRSSCFEKAGCFDLRYKIASDYEWYVRAIFSNGLEGKHINNNISIFRLGGNSTNSINVKSYFNERVLIQKQYFGTLAVLYTRLVSMARRLLGKRGYG